MSSSLSWIRLWCILVVLIPALSACGGVVGPPMPIPSPRPETEPVVQLARRGQYNPSIRFERIGVEHGLSQNSVNTILQDSQGFMWFGMEDGLNRYDGYTFKVYRPDVDDPHAISDRWVTALAEDADGNLWVGTRQGGLNRFDPRLGRFTVFRHDPDQISSLSDNWIRSILFDSRGILWVGTARGLDRFDPETGTFIHLDAGAGLASNRINVLYEDRQGMLWIGTTSGLHRFTVESQVMTVFRSSPDDPDSLISNQISALQQDADGNLWVGTPQGLVRMDRFSGLFKRYENDSTDPDSLAGNIITCLFLDRTGKLWIGTNNGLDFYHVRANRFVHYRHHFSDENSLSSNNIRSVYEDNSGVLWVGTFAGGLNKYNRQQDRFTYYRHDPEDPDSMAGNSIFPIHVDSNGIVWIGTYGNGFDRLYPAIDWFTHYRHDPNDPDSLSSDEVYSILMDRNGYLWVGTARALDRLDPRTGKFTHYRPSSRERDELGISSLPVYVIYEDEDGILWFGTSNGLDQYEPSTETFIHFQPNPVADGNQIISLEEDRHGRLWIGTFGGGLAHFDASGMGFANYYNDPHDPTSLAHNSVFSIHKDQRGNLWFGTDGGLDSFDETTGAFIHYTEKEGLPSNVIYGILEDDAGNLWMSTNNGISRFNPVENRFRNFTASDGLQSNVFNMFAYARDSRGELYFGGINGLNSFRPLEFADDESSPPIVLTSISQEGKPIETEEEIQYTREITLSWPQNRFEFGFAALSYNQPSRIQYAYMLENFDSDWNRIGTRRDGRYTNLPGGSYTLLINSTNADGIWGGSPLRIQVTVIPPVWQTNWFRLLLGLGLAAAVAGGYRLRLASIQRRNRELAALVRERTSALEKRTTEVEALYQADEKILRTVSINQVFQTLVDVAVNILQADRSAVFAWDEEQACLVPRVSHGFSPRTLSVMKFRRGEGIMGRVLETGEPLNVPISDPDEFTPALREAIVEEGIHSFVHVPIKVDNRVIAVFNVGFTRPGVINDNIVRLFTALVQRASLSIANVQLFEQTKDLAVIEERNRLARDLHDSAKQKAFAALAQLGAANGILEQEQGNIKPYVTEAENLVYEVIQELSFLIQEIYPTALQSKGLSVALREYIFEWENRNGIRIDLDIREPRPLELETEQAIYRIIQESLANIARHSRATQGEVRLVYHPDSLDVFISDNGVGFDVDQEAGGMGMRFIRERVGSIHGSIQIQSAPNAGARVMLQVPLEKSETERKQVWQTQ